MASRKVQGWPPRWLTPTTAKERERGDGDLAATFIEGYCRVVKESVGGKSGELIVVRPWQRELLKWTLARSASGKRRHRQALIGMPRKNGKSAILSSLALYELLMGPDGGEVYTVATTRDQGRIVFGTTRRMVEMDPELSEMTRLFKDAIEVPSTGSVMRVMSADAPSLEGLSPTFTIIDEVHALPDRTLYDVFSLAMGARPDPQLVGITTAGVRFDRFGSDSLAYGLYQYGKKVASGEVDDPAFGMAWWEATDPSADHRDEKVWASANPGFDDLLDAEDFRSAVKRTPEAEFRTKRLNLFVDAATAWMPHGAWDACAVEREIPKGADVVMALDGSYSNDSTALIAVEVPRGEDGKPHIVVAGLWEKPQGHAGDDWTVDMTEVENRIRECCSYWKVHEVAADPYRLTRTIQDLTEERIPMMVFPQSPARMTPATTNMYEAVMAESITHDGDKRLARHVSNAVLKVDSRGSRVVKDSKGSSRKIDACVSAIMALDRALWWRNQLSRPKPRTVAF